MPELHMPYDAHLHGKIECAGMCEKVVVHSKRNYGCLQITVYAGGKVEFESQNSEGGCIEKSEVDADSYVCDGQVDDPQSIEYHTCQTCGYQEDKNYFETDGAHPELQCPKCHSSSVNTGRTLKKTSNGFATYLLYVGDKDVPLLINAPNYGCVRRLALRYAWKITALGIGLRRIGSLNNLDYIVGYNEVLWRNKIR